MGEKACDHDFAMTLEDGIVCASCGADGDATEDGFVPLAPHPMDVIGAARLVMEASDSDRTRVAVIRRLLEHAPPQIDGDTSSVALFLDTVRAMGGKLDVH
jgi:F420-0:gamma-glutamyl ligase